MVNRCGRPAIQYISFHYQWHNKEFGIKVNLYAVKLLIMSPVAAASES